MTRFIRTGSAIAAVLATVFLPLPASPYGGLIVKLQDGSTPVNQPDLFAAALARAWGDGSRFCAAIRAQLPAGPNGTVTSCAPGAIDSSFVSNGRTPIIAFTGRVTLQGTSPLYKNTCPFTDVVHVQVQAPMTITGDMLSISAISFGPPTVTPFVEETWGAPCTGEHPGGISSNIKAAASFAASNVNFPGSTLNDTLAPFVPPMRKALTGARYTPSTFSGDLVYAVTGSYVTSRVSDAPYHPVAGASAAPGGSSSAQSRLHPGSH